MHSTSPRSTARSGQAWLALAIGAVLGLFISGHWTIAAAAWLAPIFVLRFTRAWHPWRGYLLVTLAGFVTVSVSWYGMQPQPLPLYLATMFISAAAGSLPYLLDRLLAPRLVDAAGAPRFAGTLIFPLAATAVEFLFMTGSPLGSFGALAYTQAGNLLLLQALSLGGMWLVAFLVNWLAPVVNWVWEAGWRWRAVAGGLLTFAGVLLAVLLFSGYRLWRALAPDATVPIASFTEVSLDFEHLKPLHASDRAAFRTETRAIHQAYLARTEREAAQGARIILGMALAGRVGGAWSNEGCRRRVSGRILVAQSHRCVRPDAEAPGRLSVARPLPDERNSPMSDVLTSFSGALAGLVATAGQWIVRVEGRSRLPASGVIYNAGGLVVTSHHVVERDDNLKVGLPDGRTLTAELLGRDPSTDLALLRVEGAPGTTPDWVDAADLRVGHMILALGRPGASVQATFGIVSALGDSFRTPGGGEMDHYLQTDVVMYPGFSGGPLVAADGRLAGINSSALARGVSVTIPAATVHRVVSALLAHGRMPRGYLGVGIQPVRLDAALQETLGQQTGLMVMSVEADGPAAAAGLLQGDVLVAVDGTPIRQMDDLQGLLGGDRVGRQVPVRLVRAGALHEMQVKVGQK